MTPAGGDGDDVGREEGKKKYKNKKEGEIKRKREEEEDTRVFWSYVVKHLTKKLRSL